MFTKRELEIIYIGLQCWRDKVLAVYCNKPYNKKYKEELEEIETLIKKLKLLRKDDV